MYSSGLPFRCRASKKSNNPTRSPKHRHSFDHMFSLTILKVGPGTAVFFLKVYLSCAHVYLKFCKIYL